MITELVGIALVDYDNVKVQRKEYSSTDSAGNLIAITDVLVATCRSLRAVPSELQVRFYGGWLTERGMYSQRADWVAASLAVVRGRRAGITIVPHLAVSIANCPSHRLIGSVRGTGATREQKMVDTMITVDALHYSGLPTSIVFLVSDDDDLVPAALAANPIAGPIHLVRARGPGAGLNDKICEERGVILRVLPKEFRR